MRKKAKQYWKMRLEMEIEIELRAVTGDCRIEWCGMRADAICVCIGRAFGLEWGARRYSAVAP